ncbi:hypothetical protein FSP39_014113 [Pinctada imbricata]|uniref:G-protein coupled receptors family 1 profile domain-containing protein n=1 Tax=Pinctada imbricata TaxID=66713 RepID=A0AA88XMD0_PINIB|nr:hypothetical protein FSP39_014113 [Pinctada imbricata]
MENFTILPSGNVLPKERLYERSQELVTLLLPNTILMFLLLIFGFTGNVIILYCYGYRIKKGKGQSNRDFITCLATYDLLACVLGSSFGIALNFHPLDFKHDVVCRLLWFATGTSVFGAWLILAVIAIHRYRMICRPLADQLTVSGRRKSAFMAALVGSIVAFPSLFLFGAHEFTIKGFDSKGYTCGKLVREDLKILQSFYDLVIGIVGFATFFVILILYCFVGRVIYLRVRMQRYNRKRVTTVLQERSSSTAEKDRLSAGSRAISTITLFDSKGDLTSLQSEMANNLKIKEKKNTPNRLRWKDFRFSFMFITISVMYIVSYLPRTYISIRERLDTDLWKSLTDQETVLYLFLYRMYIVNSVTNPIVYGVFDSRLRKEIRKVVCTR